MATFLRNIRLLVVASLLFAVSQHDAARSVRSINQNSNFAPWPNKEIPFYIDPAYSKAEQDLIHMAMMRVTAGVKMCIKFVEVTEAAPQFKIKITPSKAPETPEGKCYTYPGMYVKGAVTAKPEQNLVLARGSEGCFDGSLHSLMKYLTLVMGKRNEHQRPDRDQYIHVNYANVSDEMKMAYTPYGATESFATCSYDYCSITHNQPTDYAKPDMQSFTVIQPPFFIPKLDFLSTCDCQEIMSLYGCDPSQCTKVDCASMTKPITGPSQINSSSGGSSSASGGSNVTMWNSATGSTGGGGGSMGGGNISAGASGNSSFPSSSSNSGILYPSMQSSNAVTSPPLISATTVSSMSGVVATLSPMGMQGTMICYNVPPNMPGGGSSVTVTTSIVPAMPPSGSAAASGMGASSAASVSSMKTRSAGLEPIEHDESYLLDSETTKKTTIRAPTTPSRLRTTTGASSLTTKPMPKPAPKPSSSATGFADTSGSAKPSSSSNSSSSANGIKPSSQVSGSTSASGSASNSSTASDFSSSVSSSSMSNSSSNGGSSVAAGASSNSGNLNSGSGLSGSVTCSISTTGSLIAATAPSQAAQPRSLKRASKNLRTMNADPNFLKWPGNTVYFYIDPAYSEQDKIMIKLAMQKVTSDLNGCVKFQETTASDPLYKIKITPTSDLPNGATQSCHSYPGAYKGFLAQGRKEQNLILTHGKDGCFDGTLHGLMKYFAVILGKRNEHQRPDRDQYISVNPAAIRPGMEMAYQKYNAQNSVSSICPYDYCSITHNKITDYTALPGSPIFNVTKAPFFIPRVDQLSECDCKEISAIYGCPVDRCIPTNCAALGVGSTAGTGSGSGILTEGASSFQNFTSWQNLSSWINGDGPVSNSTWNSASGNSSGGASGAGTNMTPLGIGITQLGSGFPVGPTTPVPLPMMATTPFAPVSTPIQAMVYPNPAGVVSMICYMIPATTVPTSFTANIDLDDGSTGGFGAVTPAMNSEAATTMSSGGATQLSGDGITGGASFTVNAITTCTTAGMAMSTTPAMDVTSGDSSQSGTTPVEATSGQSAGPTTASNSDVSREGSSGPAGTTTAAGSTAVANGSSTQSSAGSDATTVSASGSSGGPTTPSTAAGGATTAAGEATTGADGATTPAGGATTGSGGATTGADGATTPAGGATTPAGGATTPADGATTPAGGATMPAGGATTAAGGATTAADGAITPAGGVTTGSGGATTAAGGATTAADGASPSAGETNTSASNSSAASGATTPPGGASSQTTANGSGSSSGGPAGNSDSATTPSSAKDTTGTSKTTAANGPSASDNEKGSTASLNDSASGNTTPPDPKTTAVAAAASSGSSESKATTAATDSAKSTIVAGDSSADSATQVTTAATDAKATSAAVDSPTGSELKVTTAASSASETKATTAVAADGNQTTAPADGKATSGAAETKPTTAADAEATTPKNSNQEPQGENATSAKSTSKPATNSTTAAPASIDGTPEAPGSGRDDNQLLTTSSPLNTVTSQQIHSQTTAQFGQTKAPVSGSATQEQSSNPKATSAGTTSVTLLLIDPGQPSTSAQATTVTSDGGEDSPPVNTIAVGPPDYAILRTTAKPAGNFTSSLQVADANSPLNGQPSPPAPITFGQDGDDGIPATDPDPITLPPGQTDIPEVQYLAVQEKSIRL